MEIEYCCMCGEETGRSGYGDDSLYAKDGSGPYCPDCYDIVMSEEREE